MKHPYEECRVRRELPSELRCCQHRAGCLRRWQLRGESGDRPAVQRFGEQTQTILPGWKPGPTPSDSSRCIPQCLPDSIAQPFVTNRFACRLVTLKTGRTRRARDTLAPCRGPGYRDHSSGVPTSLLLAEIDRHKPWRYPIGVGWRPSCRGPAMRCIDRLRARTSNFVTQFDCRLAPGGLFGPRSVILPGQTLGRQHRPDGQGMTRKGTKSATDV